MSDLNAKWCELVEAGKAEWMPGMLWWYSERAFERYELADEQRPIEHGAVPDWSDPATLGALLGQVRKRWNDPVLSVTACYVKDRVMKWGMDHPCLDSLPDALWDHFPTEAEALLAALEAAP
jgi:hypothetical protein